MSIVYTAVFPNVLFNVIVTADDVIELAIIDAGQGTIPVTVLL